MFVTHWFFMALSRASRREKRLQHSQLQFPGLETSETGVNRSDSTGKPDYTLVDLHMLEREAQHMSRNVASKGRDNWRKASGPEDVLRFKQGAWRHFLKWVTDVDDGEDHAAALRFNISGVERAKPTPYNS